jgi:hypothetical protein
MRGDTQIPLRLPESAQKITARPRDEKIRLRICCIANRGELQRLWEERRQLGHGKSLLWQIATVQNQSHETSIEALVATFGFSSK